MARSATTAASVRCSTLAFAGGAPRWGAAGARPPARGPRGAAAQTEWAARAESSRILRVPARVETRVLQQFRLKHQPRQERRFLQLATWGLAAAAVIVCTLGVWDW